MSKNNRQFRLLLTVFVAFFAALGAMNANASELVPQTWLPGDTLFSSIAFKTPLPVFGPGYNAVLPRVNALQHPLLKVTMKEIDQQVLPPPYGPTRVWAYETRDALTGSLLGPANWPAVTVEARRFIPTVIKYVNELPSFNSLTPYAAGLVQGLISVDKTTHWADPLHSDPYMMNPCKDNPTGDCGAPYTGPVPAVAHLHGGETSSFYDGGPEQWFTPDGLQGRDFASVGNPGPGEATYFYTNFQEPGTLWFHDHALGATRTNVYSGLAAFYLIKAPLTEPSGLPDGAYDIEMAVQDRQFDVNGQLFWPDGSGGAVGNLNDGPSNPGIHPFWIPEFIGDVAIVNGAPWPVLAVEPRRYLFRVLDGSNARFYNLSFGDTGEPSPPVYAVGGDDNFLDKPVKVNSVLLGPGERSYVIVDFSGLAAGTTVTVTNNAPIPFPDGLVPGVDENQIGMGKIMRFQVIPLQSADKSCNPATGGCKRPLPVVRLTDGNGNVASRITINKVRQLVLKEVQGEGGPIEVLVNNTKWDGLDSPGIAGVFPADGVSELPQVGSTELWEIINLTADAHPMHTHLIQFQILNRQSFDPQYVDDWGAAFNTSVLGCTPGQFCPGYGPPNPYNVPNADGAIGGNPAIGPYLLGNAAPPAPEEAGWKDTARILPGQVMRILARWTPTSIPDLLTKPGRNLYPFDPTDGPGYVWHCHIVDHEDNEMMRPYKVVK